MYFARDALPRCASSAQKQQNNLFPLYLYTGDDLNISSSKTEKGRNRKKTNFTNGFIVSLADQLGLGVSGGEIMPIGVTPMDIFNYIYSVLHSPNYRARYAEFLKDDFPRLPLAGNSDLFCALADFGMELVALHLLESPKFDEASSKFIGDNRKVSKVGWTPEDGGTVWIDGKGSRAKFMPGTAGFRPVAEEIWNFHIGGYQVCEKWLKDHGPKKGKPGRNLTENDIAHYHKIVIALAETIRLMDKIDDVIDAHGGWPDAFTTTNPTKSDA